MADQKISQLTDGTSFQAGDEAVVNRSGTNYKVDPTQFGSSIDVTGTVTADGLTVEGASSGTVTAATFTNTTSADGTRVQAVLQNVSSACNVNLVSERVGANFGADFIVETSDTVDGTDRQRLRVAETGDISFYEDTGTTPKFFWDASAERLGIGTTSPVSLLHVEGTDDVITRIKSTGADSLARLILQNDGRTWAIDNDGANSDALTFYDATAVAERMRIDASGNLLVGTTSFSSTTQGIKLDAEGDISANQDGQACAFFGRLTSDGDIVRFRKDGATVGSIGTTTDNGRFTILDVSSRGFAIRTVGGETALEPSTTTAQDGYGSLGTSGARWKDLYLSGGVYLGGTGAANLLDDYEEGTWTAGINYGSVGGTAATLSESEGSYIKIGRMVTVNFEVDVSNTNGGTGVVYIVGLPFVVDDVISPTTIEASGSIGYFAGFASAVNSLVIRADTSGGLALYGQTSSTQTAITPITAAIMDTGELRGSITYITT